MRALIERSAEPGSPYAICKVFSDQPEAPGLALAAAMGVATQILDPREYPDRAAYDGALADAIAQALKMPLAERQQRWRALWAAIEHRSPAVWGRSFVATLMRATMMPNRPTLRVVGGFATMQSPVPPSSTRIELPPDLALPIDPRRLN